MDERLERNRSLACSNRSAPLSAEVIRRWIDRLAHERIEMKIRRFEGRLKELIDEQRLVIHEPYPRYYGNPDEIPSPDRAYTRRDYSNRSVWEQLLYEAIMEGLGYSKNSDPFLELAQSMRLSILRRHGVPHATDVMALLFGAAGLIPSERRIADKDARHYARILRRRWRALRHVHKGKVLQQGDWQFFRLRPGNFPTSRLAAMCFLLPTIFSDEGFRRIISLFRKEALTARERIALCRTLFQFEPDQFWRHRFRFHRPGTTQGVALGQERIDDLLINGVIPIVLLYARVFNAQDVRRNAHAMLASLPRVQENSVTRLLQKELFKKKMQLASALAQQGAIHLYTTYCVPVRCGECEIGKQVGI